MGNIGFNIIDRIGDGTDPYMDAMRACKFDHSGYVKRMQQYLGGDKWGSPFSPLWIGAERLH